MVSFFELNLEQGSETPDTLASKWISTPFTEPFSGLGDYVYCEVLSKAEANRGETLCEWLR